MGGGLHHPKNMEMIADQECIIVQIAPSSFLKHHHDTISNTVRTA